MLRMMLRPRWVLALVAALAAAAGFALLGQWQVQRAVEQATVIVRDTETAVPLGGIVDPDEPTEQTATGQRVTVDGSWVPGDSVLVEGRLNGGTAGYWVVAHFEVGGDAAPGGLPVALGWAPDRAAAERARSDFDAAVDPATAVTLTGRFLPSEAPLEADAETGRRTTVAVAELVNLWSGYEDRPVYFGYVTAGEAPAGLAVIDSPPPVDKVELNWLNLFYAAEWVVFAGFAIFLWFRLVKDAVEREAQAAEEAAAAGSDSATAVDATR